MEYRHNILHTARESTHPCSTIEPSESKSVITVNTNQCSLPSLRSLHPSRRRLPKTYCKSSRNTSKINASSFSCYPHLSPHKNREPPYNGEKYNRMINLSIPLGEFGNQQKEARMKGMVNIGEIRHLI
jgi:hypothetical protein